MSEIEIKIKKWWKEHYGKDWPDSDSFESYCFNKYEQENKWLKEDLSQAKQDRDEASLGDYKIIEKLRKEVEAEHDLSIEYLEKVGKLKSGIETAIVELTCEHPEFVSDTLKELLKEAQK